MHRQTQTYTHRQTDRQTDTDTHEQRTPLSRFFWLKGVAGVVLSLRSPKEYEYEKDVVVDVDVVVVVK